MIVIFFFSENNIFFAKQLLWVSVVINDKHGGIFFLSGNTFFNQCFECLVKVAAILYSEHRRSVELAIIRYVSNNRRKQTTLATVLYAYWQSIQLLRGFNFLIVWVSDSISQTNRRCYRHYNILPHTHARARTPLTHV